MQSGTQVIGVNNLFQSYHLTRWVKRVAQTVMPAIVLLISNLALADGIPQPWGINLQPPASPIEEKIHSLHDALLWIITAICLFVLGLLVYVVLRYNKRANPVPSKTTHNVKLEVIWTIVPILILAGIAFPSFKLLYFSDRLPAQTDMTIKVTGRQWYWSYEYPASGISFDSRAIWDQPNTTEEQAMQLVKESSPNWLIKSEPLRLLEVDNRLVLPVGKTVRVQITAGDVLHSWFLPSMGVNRMAVPGRLNEVWLSVEREGIFYGQCSMICGTGHGFMPIVIEGVSVERFEAWVKSKKTATGQNTNVVTTKFAALNRARIENDVRN